MTHDELLARINEASRFDDCACAGALRAVVELHKPLKGTVTCHQLCETNDEYKCPTIQAIERELG